MEKIELKILKKTGDPNCTAAIHVSGKMGFSSGAINRMGLSAGKYIKIAQNAKDDSDTNLYLMVVNTEEEDTYKINKAGRYYYLNTRPLFDELNYDFQKQKYFFRLSKMDGYENTFKLIRKVSERKKGKKKDSE